MDCNLYSYQVGFDYGVYHRGGKQTKPAVLALLISCLHFPSAGFTGGCHHMQLQRAAFLPSHVLPLLPHSQGLSSRGTVLGSVLELCLALHKGPTYSRPNWDDSFIMDLRGTIESTARPRCCLVLVMTEKLMCRGEKTHATQASLKQEL